MVWTIVATAALLVGVEVWRRHRAWRHGANYVPRIQTWYAQEPVIKPLDLPPVKPLTAKRATRLDRLRRFPRAADGKGSV
jgi:hypothetical protein